MALKFGSSSKASTFKRSAFPMQSGTVSHSSALKQKEEDDANQSEIDRLTAIKTENLIAKEEDIKTKREDKKQAELDLKNKNLKTAKDAGFDTYEDYQKDQEIKIQKGKETHQTQKLTKKLKKHRGKRQTNKAYKEYVKKTRNTAYEEYKEEMGEGEGLLSKRQWMDQNTKNESLPEQSKEKWSSSDEGKQAIKDTRTKKGDRLKEKLAESKMYDDMSIEERMAYKQEKKEATNKRIRNTIATIDSIIPEAYGGGRGASQLQDEKQTKNKPGFAKNVDGETDGIDYLSEAAKSSNTGTIDTEGGETSDIQENLGDETSAEQTEREKKEKENNVPASDEIITDEEKNTIA